MFDTIGGMIIPVTSVEEACRFYGGRLELPFIGMIEKKWAGFRVGEKEVWLIQTTPEFPVKPGGDTALFFPVVNSENDEIFYDRPVSVRRLRADAKATVDATYDRHAALNGTDLTQVRLTSPVLLISRSSL